MTGSTAWTPQEQRILEARAHRAIARTPRGPARAQTPFLVGRAGATAVGLPLDRIVRVQKSPDIYAPGPGALPFIGFAVLADAVLPTFWLGAVLGDLGRPTRYRYVLGLGAATPEAGLAVDELDRIVAGPQSGTGFGTTPEGVRLLDVDELLRGPLLRACPLAEPRYDNGSL